MKTIDRITLKGLTFLSNWMYRKFGIDNYTIGMLFVGLAMIATTFIAVMTFRLAETETIEKVVKMRQGGAVMGGVIFGAIGIFMALFGKQITLWLERHHDLGDIIYMGNWFGVFYRWAWAIGYLISFPFSIGWWANTDMLCISIALMFFSCPPPPMDDRLRRNIPV